MRRVRRGLCSIAALGFSAAALAAQLAPTDAVIHRILVNRIDVEKQGVGIVVGVVDGSGRRVVSYGRLETNDDQPLDGATIFEIGSITKVFTALLLTDMAQRGEVRLDDPISRYLPTGTPVPQRDGRQITLVDLATHTSGLPRLPENFHPKDDENPYADYTEAQLYAFLAAHELIREIGVKYEYSNLGFGLLGQGLAHRAGTDYASLVEARICKPLGMTSTRIQVPPEMQRQFAAGHSADLMGVPRWDFPALPGAGALRSNANDLLAFLAAMMGRTQSPLAVPMSAMLAVRRPTGQPFMETALGWTVDSRGGGELVWKNGGTGGYRSFIGWSPRTGVGVVVLSNAATPGGVDDLGLHLLDARYPLEIPSGLPREVVLAPQLLDRYVGTYQLAPRFFLSVTREADQLYVRATGQSRAAIYPKSEREFFYKVVNARITFERNAQGQATGLVLHQGGSDQQATRVDDQQARQAEEAIAQRFKEQAAMPSTEAAVRNLIAQLQRHQVDYAQFTPELAALVREGEAASAALVASLGALQSLRFQGVSPDGEDIYVAGFDRGALECHITLTPQGKVDALELQRMR